MKRPGLGTILSLALNFFFFFWLVQQYSSDLYFQAYVNNVFGPIYPFLVLTVGVGGGSGLGYFLLKRRHTPDIIGSKAFKPRSFRPISVASPSSASSSAGSKIMPSGAPPSTTASKHTAYAVPSLAKAPSTSPSRPSSTGSSWSTGAKSSPSPILRTDTSVKIQPSSPRADETRPSYSTQSPVTRPDSPQSIAARASVENAPVKPGTPSSWRSQELPSGFERRSEVSPVFQKPGLDSSAARPAPLPTVGAQQVPGQFQNTPGSQSAVPSISKWQPPEQKPASGQWTGAQRTDTPAPVPSKWAPPSSSTGSPVLPQPQPGQGLSQPGQGSPAPRPSGQPYPPRPGFPQSQPPPRPFVYQGPRPGEPRPMGAPRPFGPDQNRPPGGFGPVQRPPPQQPQRPSPTSSNIGPMPQPWKPQEQSIPQTSAPHISQRSSSPEPSASSSQQAGKPLPDQEASQTQVPPTDASGNEMDWDTALDTILKTLRKDRVGEKA